LLIRFHELRHRPGRRFADEFGALPVLHHQEALSVIQAMR